FSRPLRAALEAQPIGHLPERQRTVFHQQTFGVTWPQLALLSASVTLVVILKLVSACITVRAFSNRPMFSALMMSVTAFLNFGSSSCISDCIISCCLPCSLRLMYSISEPLVSSFLRCASFCSALITAESFCNCLIMSSYSFFSFSN